MRQHTRVLVQFLVVATLTIPLSAQQGESFAERVDVNIVNIDMLVSDNQGKPVTGLGKAAFQLKEDNNKIKIDGFSKDGTAAASFPSMVVYVDDTHVFAAGRNAVLDALSPYLIERMSTSEAAVMVVRFDDFTEILLNFTSDPEEVKAAIDDLKQRKPNPSESMLLERNAGQQMQEARRHRGGNDVMDAMRGYATTLKRDTTRSLGALTELARSLGNEKPTKRTARKMLEMARVINRELLGDLPTVEGRRHMGVSCYVCHQGKKRPPRNVPPPQ